MKAVVAVFLAISALAVASELPGDKAVHRKIADKDFLVKQKDILRLFVRPHQHILYKDQQEIARTWFIEDHFDSYTNQTAVKTFWNVYKKGMLPRGLVFTPFHRRHLQQAIHLFDTLYHAKDFDTFYKTACWARQHVNEGQFVYAFSIAVLKRQDCRDFVLPPLYEVNPFLFVNNEVIEKAVEIRMQGIYNADRRPVKVDGVTLEGTSFYIASNYTGTSSFKHYPEESISYFTEDVGLSSWHTYWNYDYPFWARTKDYGMTFSRRGELFYYSNQQLLARFALEQLANDLSPIEHLSYLEKTYYTSGFNPFLRHQNGQTFQLRGGSYDVSPVDAAALAAVAGRLKDAVDAGFIWKVGGDKVFIRDNEGIDILGNTMEATGESLNEKFYNSYYYILRYYNHFLDNPEVDGATFSNVFDHYETVMRDSLFYKGYKILHNVFQRFKNLLPQYTYDELAYPGVKVDAVEVGNLITFYDLFDFGLEGAVDVGTVEDGEHLDIRARQWRLNHKPFTYKVKVTSDKASTVVVRVFLGPKFNSKNKQYSLNEMRDYMIELDRFFYTITVGENTIERNSDDSSVTIDDAVSYRTMFDRIKKALEDKEPYYIDQTHRHCGWPNRLLLPKGKKDGMAFRFFVMLTPFTGPEGSDANTLDLTSVPYCGADKNGVFPDTLPMGFPFDKPINNYDYFHNAPNMYFKDVKIFHKKLEDINDIDP